MIRETRDGVSRPDVCMRGGTPGRRERERERAHLHNTRRTNERTTIRRLSSREREIRRAIVPVSSGVKIGTRAGIWRS